MSLLNNNTVINVRVGRRNQFTDRIYPQRKWSAQFVCILDFVDDTSGDSGHISWSNRVVGFTGCRDRYQFLWDEQLARKCTDAGICLSKLIGELS